MKKTAIKIVTESQVETLITCLGTYDTKKGTYISSNENMIEEQATWEDADSCKSFDFTTYLFWVTTDNGATPEGFDTIAEALEYVNL